MAVIECDWHDRTHPADVLMSQLRNGETLGLCEAALLAFATGLVEAAAEGEAMDADEAALARLEEAGRAPEFPMSDMSSGEGEAPGESPTGDASEPVPPEPIPADG